MTANIPEGNNSAHNNTENQNLDLFYVDWNAGLYGRCVQNCDGPPPCGGLNTNPWEKNYSSINQCCEVQLNFVSLSECIGADTTTVTAATIQSTVPTNVLVSSNHC